MLAEFMVSPLEGAMKYVVNGVIPATVKAATKEFDSTISGVFGNIIGELGNARSNNSGGLMGILAKFLGVSTSVNRNIDTSRYEKGPIPFDGITRKAIIDVIPTHLRRIEAALTGRPEEMFDYKAGRWVKVSSLKKQFEDIKKNAVRSATADLREAMNPGIKAVRDGIDNKRDKDNFDQAVEEFYQFLYDNNGRFNPKATASKNGISLANYPNLYRHYNKIRTMFNDFDRIEERDKFGRVRTRNTRNGLRMQLSNSVLNAKDTEDRQYRDIESDMSNVLHSFFGTPKADAHGKYDSKGKFQPFNNLNSTKDKLGNTIFDYLQNINKELTLMRMNGGFGGGEPISGARKGAPADFNSINLRNPSMTNSNNYSNQMLEEGFKIWVIGLVLMAGSNVVINLFSPNKIAGNEEAIRSLITAAPYIMLFNTSILAPLIEEITFRKAFRDIIDTKWLFVIISGVVFGGLHVITSIRNAYDFLYLLPYCSLGIALSYMYAKTKNIFVSISMHALHNFLITFMNIIALGMIVLC